MSSKFDAVVKGRRGERSDQKTLESLPSRVGRPRGKRSNPEYEQITLYIRKATHQGIKRALLDTGGEKDFSELAEQLFSHWLETRI